MYNLLGRPLKSQYLVSLSYNVEERKLGVNYKKMIFIEKLLTLEIIIGDNYSFTKMK